MINDALVLSCAATSARLARFAVRAARHLVTTVETASAGPNRNRMDLTDRGYLDLLLIHPDFGVPSPTSCIPKALRKCIAEELLPGLGSRLGGRKIEDYARVPPRPTFRPMRWYHIAA